MHQAGVRWGATCLQYLQNAVDGGVAQQRGDIVFIWDIFLIILPDPSKWR